MYFESFIIVLVASALSAAPTAENDPKELMMKCCEDLNMEPGKNVLLTNILFLNNVQFENYVLYFRKTGRNIHG